jgi:sulfite exporter TauE/SafE
MHQTHALPWLLAMFLAGLLGSLGHCAGMCGPIVAAFGMAQARLGGRPWLRLLLFQLGRVTTYTMLGALIGFLGGFSRMKDIQDMHACCRPEGQALIAAQAWAWQIWVKLAIGLLMLSLGLLLLLGRRVDALMEFRLPAPLQRFLGRSLAQGGLPFVLGLGWGLIPCGLVYVMLLRTLDASSWRMGAAGMAAFGLGSMPVLLGLGFLGARLSQAWRSRLLQLGGLLVAGMGAWILIQAITLLRLQLSGG